MFDTLMQRRAILSLAASGSLAGCGMASRSPFFSTIATFNRSPSPPISREKIDALPYASLVAWFDGSARALLVLGQYEANDRLVWYSAERQALTTWGPYVLNLIGTEVSLRSSSLTGVWSPDLRTMIGREVGRTLEFDAPSNRVSVATRSRFSSGARCSIKLIGEQRTLLHVQEHVRADGWHNYTNDYWIDEQTGLSWKSRQLVVPTMAKMNLVIGRMPKGLPQSQA